VRSVEAARAAGEPTVPTTIALERATNRSSGSLRADLAERRAWKDSFGAECVLSLLRWRDMMKTAALLAAAAALSPAR
jgi:hypothetical protein